MKKICLLLIPLLLCSCGSNIEDNKKAVSSEITSQRQGYTIYKRDSGDTKYVFYIDYNNGGKLVIAKSDTKEGSYEEYKSFPLGSYECYKMNNVSTKEYVYDYGDYAIWVLE